jgi:hypothetical protein
MYKALSVAVLLLAVLAFTFGNKSAGSTPTLLTSPVIVARGELRNQTMPISQTILTPTSSGLFRLSIYAEVTTGDPNSSSAWSLTPGWTDDTGVEYAGNILEGYGQTLGQFLYQGDSDLGGATVFFRANEGTSINFMVSQLGPPDGSAYAVYYTLERTE